MASPKYPFSFKQKTILSYAFFAVLLFVLLKWIDTGFILSVIDFFFIFYPVILILIVSLVSYSKYQSYKKAALDLPHIDGVKEKLRLETLQTIAALLAISFLFYLLYSPQSYLPVLLVLLKTFPNLLTLETIFLLLAWGLAAALVGSLLYTAIQYFKVKNTPQENALKDFLKRIIRLTFLATLSLLVFSFVSFNQAYQPITQYLGSAMAPLFGEESNMDLTFSTSLAKSVSLLKRNVSSANGDLLGEIKGTKSDLDTAIATSGLKISGQLSDEIKTRLSNSGGTIKGSLVIQDSFDVLGDTFLQDVFPQSTDKYDLGSEAKRWNTLYANSGNFSQAVITGNLSVSGTISGTFTDPTLSTGSVVFIDASKALSEDSAFSYDQSTKRLSIQNIVSDTFNGNTLTTGTGTLTLATGKTLTASNTLTFAGVDNSTLNIGLGGTLGTAAYVAETNYALLAGRSGGKLLSVAQG